MVATTFMPGFDVSNNPLALPTYSRVPMQQRLRQYANEQGMSDTYALINALLGAVAGGTASYSKTKVKGNSGSAADNGGKMQTETLSTINRTTTSGDVTALKALITNVRRAPSTYPKDLSGNGGPTFTPG